MQSWVPLPLKWTIPDSGQPTQDHVLGNFQPSPRDSIGRSSSHADSLARTLHSGSFGDLGSPVPLSFWLPFGGCPAVFHAPLTLFFESTQHACVAGFAVLRFRSALEPLPGYDDGADWADQEPTTHSRVPAAAEYLARHA